MQIIEVSEFSSEIYDSVRSLLRQLSKNSPALTDAHLRSVITSECSHLLICWNGNTVLGMLTLVLFPIPTGVRAWIEDVVVDESGRGKGIGNALSQFALNMAKEGGAKTVELTSRPSREAANRLYQRIGFKARETNVYRIELDQN